MAAIALQGAVVVEEKGNFIKYKRKCQSCGHVSQSAHSVARKAKIKTAFTCSKCKKRQEVVIQGK